MYHWLSLRWLVLSSGRFAHSMMNTLLCKRGLQELHFSRQATLQPQLIIYSTLSVAAAWTVAICDNKPSVIYQPYCSQLKLMIIVEASSELDGIIFILGGFRWIHNERYLDLLHSIEHIMLSGHAYARHYAHIFSHQNPWQHWYSIDQAWWMR